MSYYYTYYIGYKLDGKYYPLGPYDSFGKLHPVIIRSRNYASDLHYDFWRISREEASEELIKEFEYTNWNDENCFEVKVLSFEDLGDDNFIKKGYFLISDIDFYEKHGEDAWNREDIFCEWISPTAYAKIAENERQYGKPERQVDEFGTEYTPRSAADYSYYAYPDYSCRQFEVFELKQAMNYLTSTFNLPKNAELYVLETEG